MCFTLRGARLVDATADQVGGAITVEGGLIRASGPETDEPGTIIDAAGMLVMPGFIDVHTHGGGGFNLHTLDPDEIRAYARWVTRTGVTSFLIGVVGTPGALPEGQLAAAVEAIEGGTTGAEALGIFMEGPYISPLHRGAHPLSWLRTPDEAETARILHLTGGHLRLLTLAPELPNAAELIRRLVEAGVTVSIGHTDATYEQARAAIQLGITHMTHCFNTMRPIYHREPGPIEAVVQASQVRGELIGDGIHVHPAVMDVLVRLLGPSRVVVITDAQAGAGLENAVFEFGGQRATVICGAARLDDGTLAGSALTMDQALRNMLHMTGSSLQEVVAMLTDNPAQSVGLDRRKGRLQAGYDADLLLFDEALTLQATICRGVVAYVTEAWQNRLPHET